MNQVVESIRKELQQLSDPEGQLSAQRFHKEEVKTYGLKVPVTRKLAKQRFRDLKPMGKDRIFEICHLLFASGYLEEAMIASEWTYLLRQEYQEKDMIKFEYWIEHHIHNWSTCDHFCNNSVGAFLLKYPSYVERLKKWAVTDHRWLQRAAAVSLIVPVRQGRFIPEVFRIAELELESKDDLVQKGYGWLLKVCSRRDKEAVYQYVNSRKHLMPRTALRYAIEHFPKEEKRELMRK